MATQSKAFLDQIKAMYKRILKQDDYRGYKQSLNPKKVKHGACLTCHGSGLVAKAASRKTKGGSSHLVSDPRMWQPKVGAGIFDDVLDVVTAVSPANLINRVRRGRGKSGGGKSGGKRKSTVKKGSRPMNPWIKHLKAYHKAHPKLSYKQAMSAARSSY